LALAFVFAFLSHDSDKEYDARHRKYMAASRELDRVKARHVKNANKIHKKHARKIKNAKDAFVAAGGDARTLEKDDFRSQLAEAEGERVTAPPPEEPTESREPTEGSNGMKVIAGGRTNPW
jgi:hypothetical protein